MALSTALPAGADSEEPWRFDGGGWGHGLGLSQFGAQGMALDGHSAHAIIGHYYSGAQVQTLTQVGAEDWLYDPEAIWVGLSRDQTSRFFESIGGNIDICLLGDGSETCDTRTCHSPMVMCSPWPSRKVRSRAAS